MVCLDTSLLITKPLHTLDCVSLIVEEAAFECPPDEFHSKKLLNKLVQQIHEPLVLASCSLPEWCNTLTVNYPVLFPFEVREVFFNCTAFGSSR